MPDSVLYIRGIPPALSQVSFAEHPEALEDLKRVARLTQEQALAIKKRLQDAKGFLDPRTLASAVREILNDEEVARAVQRVLRNIEPKRVKPLLSTLTERQAKPNPPLDEATLESLRRTLPILVQPYPAIERFEKALRLSTLTGQQLESLDLICDIRPIFDEKREQLEGLMPLTRLRIVAIGADGLPNAFEAELTHEQVGALAEKASKARQKLQALRASIQRWSPDGLPYIPLTRPDRAEATDA